MRSLLLCLLVLVSELVQGSPEVLPVDQAFRYQTNIAPNGDVLIRWTVDGCCYLYRDKFKFTSLTSGVQLGPPGLPQAERKHDEFLGDTWIYRGNFEVAIPLRRANDAAGDAYIELAFQGCADQGICYPPQKRKVPLPRADALRPAAAASSALQPLDRLAKAFQDLTGPAGSAELLPAEQAFRFSAEVAGPRLIRVGWQIADGYYLYREKFKLGLEGSDSVRLGVYAVPRGEPRLDEEFGAVEVFHREVEFTVPLLRDGTAATVQLAVSFQGCADRGVCYPPMSRQVKLDLPAITADAGGEPLPEVSARPVPRKLVAEHDRIAATFHGRSIGLTLLSFLGFGLLLAFTPCMFPMIPILSGIIIGQGHPITTRRAFLLSLSYVIASALTYTVFGILAGLFGSNLQALFQAPWIVVSFSLVFVLLALSMFGFFQLHFPTFIQSRIAAVSSKQQRGSLSGAAIMGALSALVMGPCVAPPLAGALIYIGQTGDAWLGGAALFALGVGMGIPLLVIGASAGKLLPKVGLWMNAVKGFFGVGLLAVAVWLLERVVPPAVALFLWALLLIIPAIYLGALDALPQPVSGWRKLWKGVGVVMLVYGVLLLFGVATNGSDPLQPLRNLGAGGVQSAQPAGLAFERVRSVEELDQRLKQANEQGRWVMLDYYADWCVSCKEMERYTFADPLVKAALAEVVLLQADVTENSDGDQALLRRFNLIGPPATLFFGPDREERPGLRVVGYLDPEQFLEHLRRVPSCLLEC
jgi:thiol:disulfide interchange protein DsbD